MTDLLTEVTTYLKMRRGLGFKLVDAGWLLPDFAKLLNRHHTDYVTTQLALAWAMQPGHADRVW